MPSILVLDHDLSRADALAAALTGPDRILRVCRLPHQGLRQLRLIRWDLFWLVLPVVGMDPGPFFRRVRRLRPTLRVVAVLEPGLEPQLRHQLKADGAAVMLTRPVPAPVACALAAALLRRPPLAPPEEPGPDFTPPASV